MVVNVLNHLATNSNTNVSMYFFFSATGLQCNKFLTLIWNQNRVGPKVAGIDHKIVVVRANLPDDIWKLPISPSWDGSTSALQRLMTSHFRPSEFTYFIWRLIEVKIFEIFVLIFLPARANFSIYWQIFLMAIRTGVTSGIRIISGYSKNFHWVN